MITIEMGTSLARELGCKYTEISTKMNFNVKEAFTLLIRESRKLRPKILLHLPDDIQHEGPVQLKQLVFFYANCQLTLRGRTLEWKQHYAVRDR